MARRHRVFGTVHKTETTARYFVLCVCVCVVSVTPLVSSSLLWTLFMVTVLSRAASLTRRSHTASLFFSFFHF